MLRRNPAELMQHPEIAALIATTADRADRPARWNHNAKKRGRFLPRFNALQLSPKYQRSAPLRCGSAVLELEVPLVPELELPLVPVVLVSVELGVVVPVELPVAEPVALPLMLPLALPDVVDVSVPGPVSVLLRVVSRLQPARPSASAAAADANVSFN